LGFGVPQKDAIERWGSLLLLLLFLATLLLAPLLPADPLPALLFALVAALDMGIVVVAVDGGKAAVATAAAAAAAAAILVFAILALGSMATAAAGRFPVSPPCTFV